MITKKQKQVLDFITLYRKKRGYSPSLEEIQKKFRLASVSTAHFHVKKLQELGLLEKKHNKPRSINIYENEKMVNIPLLGLIAAGQPIEAIQDKETIAFPQNKLPRFGEFYALRVAGNSMIEENIKDGDIILVKEQQTVENGQKVVALIDNYKATLKTFYKERDKIRLQPANKNYEPIIIKSGEREIVIQGLVIDVIKNNEELQATELLSQKEIKRYNNLPLNKVICGDAIEELKKLPNKSIDLILTDPPYGLNKKGISNDTDLSLFYSSLPESYRVLKDNSFFITFFSTKFLPQIFRSNPFEYFWNFVLYCPNGSVSSPIGYTKYMSCMVFKKGNPKMIKRGKDIFVDTPGRMVEPDEGFINHPTPKPKTFIKDILLMFSRNGDIVLDPFIGSGSTAIACKQIGRNFIGFEIDVNYYKLAKERLKKIEGKSKTYDLKLNF